MNDEIKKIVEKHFESLGSKEFVPGVTPVPTMGMPFGHEEVNEAIDSLLSTYVTMGKKVKKFEEVFAKYIGVKEGIMVNSGSSANLLALSVLTNPALENRILPGEEIITPAVTWATTVYPIYNVGAVPVFVDVDTDFNINPDLIEESITKKTRAIMPVHLVGNPCNMRKIMKIAEEHDLFVVEDTCEAHGAEFEHKKMGSFGDFSTFSFFFSHHITTIEGGMVMTNNEKYSEIARAMRAFGWIRDIKNRNEIASKYKHIDPRVLFINLGFNIRPTEINAAFGIHQISKIENLIKHKTENTRYWNERFKKYSNWIILPEEKENMRHSWFVYPLIIKPNAPFTRDEITIFLENNKIETRLVAAGDITQQPVIDFITHRKHGDLKNSKMIMNGSFYFGNHAGIMEPQREYIADKIDEFMRRF